MEKRCYTNLYVTSSQSSGFRQNEGMLHKLDNDYGYIFSGFQLIYSMIHYLYVEKRKVISIVSIAKSK